MIKRIIKIIKPKKLNLNALKVLSEIIVEDKSKELMKALLIKKKGELELAKLKLL